MDPSIYSYIKSEENTFESEEIQVGDNWFWNFRKHVQLIFHLKNGIFFTGENDWLRAFKNIMEPLLNLSYWTEDIEVKDVVFFIENRAGRVLSFFVKKYHDEVYTRKYDLDAFLDKITESDLDYGGVIVQRTSKGLPEVLKLNTVAFCDQTDVKGGPIGFKLGFSPSKLRSMAKYGWGSESNGATIGLDDLVILATPEKSPAGLNDVKKNNVTGKAIEVYIVHGDLPEHYLKDNNNMEDYYSQLQIVAFYTNREGKKEGVTLYRKKADDGNLKFFTSKEVPGRALGRGVGETLLGPQIWTNFLTIHKTNFLEAASKVPLYTDDQSYTNKNKIQDMENLEVTTIEEGKRIFQVPTAATANINLYQNAISEWFSHAQLGASAEDPILGKEPVSGTTFRGQERTVAQGKGIHDRRRGQRAKFTEEIYRDWIIPDMVKEMFQGKEFLATLTAEEMNWVREQLVMKADNENVVKTLLSGKLITDEEREVFKQRVGAEFSRKGNKHILKLVKKDLEGVEIKMGINIANKQKDLMTLSDKMLSIFQYVFANPQGFQQAMQIPALAGAFNDILEFGGLNQVDFATLSNMKLPAPAEAQTALPGAPAPLQLNPQEA